MERDISHSALGERSGRGFAPHGVIGLGLIVAFWTINWGTDGLRSHWAFFPLWLGFCLLIDALVLYRTGTSLLARSWRKYIGLFLVSAPVWWIFEALNLRLQNWRYIGTESFTSLEFIFWSTLNFTIVVPAVFGAAELAKSFDFVRRLGKGPVIRPEGRTPLLFFLTGWGMLALMLLWPRIFFPFVWLSVYFILEPINVWLGHRSLADWTRTGDWRPIIALWIGVLITGFFWEMWNFFSYPKWVYDVPGVGFWKVFEMPLLGYSGYLPFALELYAMYHLVVRLLGEKRTDYVRVDVKD